MRYMKPTVHNLEKAMSAIQQVSLTDNSLKTPDIFTDSNVHQPAPCTVGAYEADE